MCTPLSSGTNEKGITENSHPRMDYKLTSLCALFNFKPNSDVETNRRSPENSDRFLLSDIACVSGRTDSSSPEISSTSGKGWASADGIIHLPVGVSGEVALEHELLPSQDHDLLTKNLYGLLTSVCRLTKIPKVFESAGDRFRGSGAVMESGLLCFDRSVRKESMMFLGNGDSVFGGSRTMMISMEEGSRSRLCFSSPDDLFDDEYYDEQSPEKKRRLSSDQVHMLEKSFESENKLEPERKSQLAKKLGLQPRQVAVWFQNRRARWKTRQLERDYNLLRSSYDSLISDYDSIAKQNDLLKSEVISLTEKLQAKEEISGVVQVQPGSDQKCSPLLEGVADDVSVHSSKDHLSSGTSAVVDSGDSYFPDEEDYPGGGMEAADEKSYFSNVFAFSADQQQNNSEGEALHWWVWS